MSDPGTGTGERSPLAQAANRNDLAAVQAILAAGGCAKHDLDVALARAVLRFGERRAIAELLLASGADPNGQYGGDYGPIALVTGECLDPEGMRFLAGHGADLAFPPFVSKYGPTSMLISVLGTYTRDANARKHACIDLLLAAGAPIPPAVTPAILAIHRGDGAALARELAADPGLATRTIPDLPYGNTVLAGATLLHAAVEFAEPGCIDVLLEHGADPNARAELDGEIGGHSPVFHAIPVGWEAGTPWLDKLRTLEHLLERAAGRIDLHARAVIRRSDGSTSDLPATPAELALRAPCPPGAPAARIAELLLGHGG